MISQGPFDLTIGSVLSLPDPGANSNNPATAVQFQNASPFIIEVNSGGLVLTIQSFTAQTVAAAGSQPLSVTPIQANSGSAVTAAAVLSVVWLLAGEQSPMLDGPLTAAAITFGLGATGLAGETGGLAFVDFSLVAGQGVGPISLLAPGVPVRLWNWGVIPTAATSPTEGGFQLVLLNYPALLFSGMDTLTWQEGASNRLAGLAFQSLTLNNFSNQPTQIFICFTPV